MSNIKPEKAFDRAVDLVINQQGIVKDTVTKHITLQTSLVALVGVLITWSSGTAIRFSTLFVCFLGIIFALLMTALTMREVRWQKIHGEFVKNTEGDNPYFYSDSIQNKPRDWIYKSIGWVIISFWVVLAYVMVFTTLLLPDKANAGNEHPEKWYQERWCAEKGGEMEVVLPDRTRCDCLTTTNAVEFDFGPKWAEAIGQALYYSIQTGKRAGVVLILEKSTDRRYWIRLNSVIEHFRLPIDTWEIK